MHFGLRVRSTRAGIDGFKFLVEHFSVLQVKSVGIFFGSPLYVPDVPDVHLFVPDATVRLYCVHRDCEVSFDSDCEFVESQILSQEEMYFYGTPEKAPPASRRKIMLSIPQQSPQPLLESTPRRMEVEDQEFGSRGKD